MMYFHTMFNVNKHEETRKLNMCTNTTRWFRSRKRVRLHENHT